MSQETLKRAGFVVAIAVFLLIIILVWQSLSDLQKTSRDGAREKVSEAINQAVMQCYALEGAYPPGLVYLQENYGLILDDSRFAFYYEVVGDNIYPIVDVQLLEDVR
ncbi:MAG: hypothetical protein GX173_07045 [Ruminococcaceae bacterium]|jgi:hypothetical protein|nr:hypothetical protein [Oscillospiraceae bacterium]